MSDQLAHRNASIELIPRTGAHATVTHPRSKAAKFFEQGKAYSNAIAQKALNIAQSDENVNVGLYCFGRVVDVDIDNKDPEFKSILGAMLPDTPHRWGRPSNPDSHYLYQITFEDADVTEFDRANYPILETLKRRAGVEILGGPLSAKKHCVLPGSTYVNDDGSTEYSRWHDLDAVKQSMRRVPFHKLLATIRKAAAISFLRPYWTDGNRHQLTMALSGILYRLYMLNQDPEMDSESGDGFCMDKQESLGFLKALMKFSGDDPSDAYARVKTFESTWDKARRGEPVTGGARLAELTGSKELPDQVYSVLSSCENLTTVEQFMARFAIMNGYYLDIERARHFASTDLMLMSQHRFDIDFGHWFYLAQDGKRKPLTRRLMKMNSAMRIIGMVTDPNGPSLIDTPEGLYYNTWNGFDVPPVDHPVEHSDVELFFDYMFRVLASKEERIYNWLMSWIAQMFQDPADKPGTALVLVGKPGTGKTMLHQHILRPIIGQAHSIADNNVYNLVKGFNALYANRLLIACDEATSRRQKDAFDKLKTLITDDTIRVEPKGKDAFLISNIARLLFTSNHELDAVHLPDGQNDRRYVVIKVSDAHRVDHEYFGRLVEWLSEPDSLAKIHRWLLQWEIKPEHDPRKVLHTRAKQDIQNRSAEVFDHWLLRIAEDEFPLSPESYCNWWDAMPDKGLTKEQLTPMDRSIWPKYVNYKALVEDYNLFLKANNHRDQPPITETLIGVELHKRGLKPTIVPIERRVRKEIDKRTSEWKEFTGKIKLHGFPPLEDIKKYLESDVGLDLNQFNSQVIDDPDNVGEDNGGPNSDAF